MNKIYTFIFISFFSFSLIAQDIHFSQFYASPLTLNPANTGLFNGNIRGVLNYRNQWNSFAPFNTYAGSADMNFGQSFLKDDLFGIGINFFADKAGDANFATTQANISVAYIKTMGSRFSRSYLSVGFQGGIAQRSIDYTKLTFGSQFNGFDYDPSISSGETIAYNNFAFLDFSGGISWLFVPKNRMNIYAGAAFYHVNQPDISFSNGGGDNLYMKISSNIGAQIPLGDYFDIVPAFLAQLQGPHSEFMGGTSFKYYISERSYNTTAISFGGWQRIGIDASQSLKTDATVISARFDYMGLSAGLSYDINTSSLKDASNSFGGPEISLIYTSELPHRSRKVDCPKF